MWVSCHHGLFSADSEHSLNTSSEAPESLCKGLRGDSNDSEVLVKTVQAILVADFLVLMHSSPMSFVSSCRSALGTIIAGE
jgi:hypothetical protein